jgi:hypothetical protein
MTTSIKDENELPTESSLLKKRELHDEIVLNFEVDTNMNMIRNVENIHFFNTQKSE